MARYTASRPMPPLPKVGPGMQLLFTVLAAIVLSGMVFSGLLVFRQSDYDDLMGRGEHLVAEGKVARAAAIYERVLSQYGEGYAVYLALGKAYLAMNEPEKARKVLEAALALKTRDGGVEALLVKSQLLVVAKEYQPATELLHERLKTLPKDHPSWKTLRVALSDAYTYWADEQRQNGELEEALATYQKGLAAAGTYSQEEAINKDLSDIALQLAEQYLVEKKPEALIETLRPVLDISPDPALMIRLADAYQDTGELEQAITWYRRAYDSQPELIRAKLSQAMLARGKELLKEGKSAEAAPYFSEAESMIASNTSTDEAMASLYPVEISSFNVIPNFNRGALLVQPSAKITVKSLSHRDISDLLARLQIRTESEVLSESQATVASSEKPLTPSGKESTKSLTIGTPSALSVSSHLGSVLTLQVSVSYDGGNQWHTKAIQQLKIQGQLPAASNANGEEDEPEAGQKRYSFVDGTTRTVSE